MRAWNGFNWLRIGLIFGVFTLPSFSSPEGMSDSDDVPLSLKMMIIITIVIIVIIRIELELN